MNLWKMSLMLGFVLALNGLSNEAKADFIPGRVRVTQTANNLDSVDSQGAVNHDRGANFSASREDGRPGFVSFGLTEWYSQFLGLRVPPRRYELTRSFRVTGFSSPETGVIEYRAEEISSSGASAGDTLTVTEDSQSQQITIVERHGRHGAVEARYQGTYQDLMVTM